MTSEVSGKLLLLAIDTGNSIEVTFDNKLYVFSRENFNFNIFSDGLKNLPIRMANIVFDLSASVFIKYRDLPASVYGVIQLVISEDYSNTSLITLIRNNKRYFYNSMSSLISKSMHDNLRADFIYNTESRKFESVDDNSKPFAIAEANRALDIVRRFKDS